MRFDIRAVKGAEGIVALTLDAGSEEAALAAVRAQGLTVLSARPRRALPALPRLFAARFPLLLFSQELVALLGAGLSLPETLETLAEKESNAEHRRVFAGLQQALLEGQSFSRAVERFPAVFPKLYVATVRAAERSGDLAEALGRYIAYQERLDLVKKKVLSASIYPVVLMGVGGLVTLFLLGYVVPRFSSIYADSNRALPFLSKLLLDWGQLLNANGVGVVLALLALGAAAAFAALRLHSPLTAALGRIPAVGSRLLVYQLARFYRTIGMLLRGGTPLVPALEMTAGLLMPDLRPRLAAATRRIREGSGISAAMEASGLTTPVAMRLLRVGERSGEMAEMMERIAVFHDEELARWVDWFTRLFEPILMALIGVVIGAIVVLMYLPIFELAGSLQ
jgi:general secretion pathway protein F